jgi:hypothetical protein
MKYGPVLESPMSDLSSSIVFPAFNAKLMRVDEIVDSFVPSDLFNPAIGVSHSLIMGPRGSGKTTLLKMLSVDFLRRWHHSDAEVWRQSAIFNGIFLPADIVWAETARENRSKKLDDNTVKTYSESLFCTSVLLAAIDAFEVKVSKETGIEAANYGFFPATIENIRNAIGSLSKLWQLKNTETTFTGLRNTMLLRLMDLQSYVRNVEPNSNLSVTDLTEKFPFFTFEPHSLLDASITAFDADIGDKSGLWALLVDEMEIVPPDIQRGILNRFRSGSKKLIYKVAVVPCTSEVDATLDSMMQANPKNDFQRVSLWYSKKNQSKSFSESLFKAWLKRQRLDVSISPYELLGSSLIVDEEDEEGRQDSSEGNERYLEDVFNSLIDKDATFAEYIKRRKIDVTDLKSTRNSELKSEIRKIKPTVEMREAMLRNESGEMTSRKSLAEFYSGWQAIMSICEGNPRWLNAYLSGLYSSNLAILTSGKAKKISRAAQASEVKKCASAYAAMLRSIARKDPMVGFSTDHDVFKLLDSIGAQFKQHLYNQPFTPEPALSFVVDADVSADEEAALKIALNHGAIVYADELKSGTDDFQTLKQKRFRLTYLFATNYSLILRLHKEISLSKLLSLKIKANSGVSSTQIEATPLGKQGSLDFL